jgi:hypothetical protein
MSNSTATDFTLLPTLRYLKHVGSTMDIKVTIHKTLGHSPVIFIRDYEFNNVLSALMFLRHVAETEIGPEHKFPECPKCGKLDARILVAGDWICEKCWNPETEWKHSRR